MIKLTVRKERLGPVLGRHPWLFSGALKSIPNGLIAGEPVELYNENNQYLAGGYFSSYSQIAVRLWSFQEGEIIDDNFFIRRVERAHALRQKYLASSGTNAYRLINGESDLLPGLIVDKYNDYLSLQFHTKGMELYKTRILSALQQVIKPKGIYERSENLARRQDGLESYSALLSGEVPERVEIEENNLKFLVDIKEGQKTGFFLDQRDKRKSLQTYCRDAEVLNCFSYSGGFSVYALAAGAKRVVSVDVSASAMDLAKENIKLNGFSLERCEFIVEDVKKYLPSQAPNSFDVIILDPPAFIKDRHKKIPGVSGYKRINELALPILREQGILVSCSCSYHLSLEEFRRLLTETFGRNKVTAQLLESQTHNLDHPILCAHEEGSYLKTLFFRILK
ncbi:MAG: class I SAM-dependent rRNA methyltransferase [Planctomycetes bacterium]|jgi:23S rRNA (cytosine1962-C5)-methyltransferase|nr:class I SAM-dependent rRNA methyltransferase [Planctomycetota bacterium]